MITCLIMPDALIARRFLQNRVPPEGRGSLEQCPSIFPPKGRTVFGPAFPPVVKPRSRHIGMAEPLWDLGDVRIVRQRVGSGCRAQRVHAQPDNFAADASFGAV